MIVFQLSAFIVFLLGFRIFRLSVLLSNPLKRITFAL